MAAARFAVEICGQELGEELLLKKRTTVDQIIQDLSNFSDRRLDNLDILAKKVLNRMKGLLHMEDVTKRWMDAEFKDSTSQQWGVQLQCSVQIQALKEALV